MDISFASWHQSTCDRLMTELAVTLGLSPADLIETRHLVVAGVDVGLLDHGALDLGRVTLFMDLGGVPESDRAAVYRRLLEQNLILPRTFGTFALIPDHGHAALVHTLDLSDELSGEHLASIIGELVEQYCSVQQSLVQEYRFTGNTIPV